MKLLTRTSRHLQELNRGKIIVTERLNSAISLKIPETGKYVFGDKGEALKVELKTVDSTFTISKDKNIATLDARNIRFPLIFRNVRNGDRFVPFGMKGSKLVSDYLTDRHRSLNEKRNQMVVEDADGRIIWLAGERTDNRFRVDAATTEVLIITLAQND